MLFSLLVYFNRICFYSLSFATVKRKKTEKVVDSFQSNVQSANFQAFYMVYVRDG